MSDFSGFNSTLTLLLSFLYPLELHNSGREGSDLQKNKQEALRLRDSTCFIRQEHIVNMFAVTPGGSEGSLISHVCREAKVFVSFWVWISQSGWTCCAPNREVTPTCFKLRNKMWTGAASWYFLLECSVLVFTVSLCSCLCIANVLIHWYKAVCV